MVNFRSLSAPGLSVVTADDESFLEAISNKAYNSRINQGLLPSAVLVATDVSSVQSAVQFCSENGLKICVRSGGHNWHNSWLQGKGTVILDVGDINEITFDASSQTAKVGPGATGSELNDAIPDDLLFPCGHCPGVPIGGFLLGGGFGLGFPKYGMSFCLVVAMEVVLASGEVKTVRAGEEDEISRAVTQLAKGSYTLFPAVVTKYVLRLVPTPKCVLSALFIFKISDWEKVLSLARDIHHRGDEDAKEIEVVALLGYSPPPIAEATGESKMAGLNFIIWGDDEASARKMYAKYSKLVSGTLVPVEDPSVIPAKKVPEIFGPFYPSKARYHCEGNLIDESVHNMPDEQVAGMMKPIADMWMSEHAPPPPSHTLFAMAHPSMKTVNGGDHLVEGYTPGLVVLSYAIYFDEDLDETMASTVASSHAKLKSSAGVYTEVCEGNIRSDGEASGFVRDALIAANANVALLDPHGVFSRGVNAAA